MSSAGSETLGLKICFVCEKSLPTTAFHSKVSAKDGLNARCRICARAYYKEWRANNPELAKAINERSRRKNPGYAQQWQSQNMDRHMDANRRYRDRNIIAEKPSPDTRKVCKKCGVEKALYEFWVCANTKDGRMASCATCASTRYRWHGVDAAKFTEMWTAQNGECAICHEPMRERGKGGASLDHDHRTGKIRALLCGPCNSAIGLLKDDPDRCEAASAYLRGFHSE